MFKSTGLAKMFAGRRKFFGGPHVRHLCTSVSDSGLVFQNPALGFTGFCTFKNPGFPRLHLLEKVDASYLNTQQKDAICAFTLFNALRTIMKRVQIIT